MANEPEAHHYDVPVDRLHQAVLAAVAEAADSGGSTLTIGGTVAQRGMGKVQQVSWGEAGRIAVKLKQGVDAALVSP